MAFTYFFRDRHTLQLAADISVRQRAGNPLSVWIAGCASGQEAYSLAILLAEKLGPEKFAHSVDVLATDRDQSDWLLGHARAASYRRAEVERVSPEYIARYFQCHENTAQVQQMIRDRIRFENHDLLTLIPATVQLDLIVCKNVLLHFTAEQRCQVVHMFYQALKPAGCLAVEQTQKLPVGTESLFRRATPDAQVFQKVDHAMSCEIESVLKGS